MKPMYYMTKRNLLTTIGMLAVVSAFAQKEYPSRAPMTPAMSEYWTPQPPIVTPGKAPAEAIGLNWKTLKDKLRDGLFMMEYSQ